MAPFLGCCRRRAPLLCAFALCGSALLGPATVAAEGDAERISLALFPITIEAASTVPVRANKLNAALFSELDQLAAIQVAARPALDLPTTQLALGCEDSRDECLQAAVGLAHARALLAPSLHQTTGGALELRILFFDAKTQVSKTALRTLPQPLAPDAATNAFASMVHELFDPVGEARTNAAPGERPEAAGEAGSASPPAGTASPTTEPSDAVEESGAGPAEPAASHREAVKADPLPLVPIVVGAAGVALLATGVTFGILANDSKQAYASGLPHNDAEANALADRLSTGRLQAALCNIGLAVGGAALVTAVTLYLVDEHQAPKARDTAMRRTPRTMLLGSVSPHGAALVLHRPF